MKHIYKRFRLLVILMAFILCFPLLCYAEEAEEEVDTTYAAYLECALDATAQMVSQAIQDDVYYVEGEDGWDFRIVSFGSPLKAIIIFPSDNQWEQLQTNLNATGTDIGLAIADMANVQWSDEYAEKANAIITDGSCFKDMDDALVVLLYDRHLSLTCIKDDEYCAEFLMGDGTVLPSVDETYIPKIAQDLNVEGEIEQILYESDEIEAIYGKDDTSEISDVVEAIVATEDTILQMAPEALFSETYGHNSHISLDAILAAYMKHQEGRPVLELTPEAKILAEQIMEESADWSWDGVTLDPAVYTGEIGMETVPEFPKENTILVISRSERDDEVKVDYTYESLLPSDNIPESEEDADYILLVDSKWEYQYTQNDIDIYVCKTVLSLLDAKTGELIGIIGSSYNTLSGFVVVSGSTYYPSVDREDVKQVIKNWIQGEG